MADGASTIEDDRDLNRISLSEHYKFPNQPVGFSKYTPYLPSYLRGFFSSLPGSRLYPYAIDQEIRRQDTVVIESPGADIVDIKSEKIDNRQFSYSRDVTKKSDEFSMAFDFTIKDRQVPLSDYASFREAADKLDNSTYNTISFKIAQTNAERSITVTAKRVRGQNRLAGFILAHKSGGLIVLSLIAGALILMSVRYGLRADRDYAEQGLYFPISLKKFVALQFVTLGIYGNFWMWKCWRWVKIRDQRRMQPFWRSVFVYFYWNSLFQNIRKRDLAVAFPKWLGLSSLVVYIALISSQRIPVLQGSGKSLPLLILASFCMLPMVSAVNRLNAGNDIALKRNSAINGWNVLAFVVGGVVFTFMIIGIIAIAFQGDTDN